jgi:AhpD family alkylhydroperoxidase
MNKQQIYQEMEGTMGVVPSFFKRLQNGMLESEWQLFKQTEMVEGPVPQKYRELIGLGVAAAIKCKYCLFYHTEMAKLHGASDAEIEDAAYAAKCTAGWSNYVSALQTDFDQFKREILQACDHVRSSRLVKV